MNPAPAAPADLGGAPQISEPAYQVVLGVPAGEHIEPQIREVIERTRGDLKRLHRHPACRPTQLHLHLGVRRIDDVVTALEGAGFDVRAVVALSLPRPPSPAHNARSSSM